MESVLNNLLLLVENNCNEGTYVKASDMIKKAYELQNNNDNDNDSDSDSDYDERRYENAVEENYELICKVGDLEEKIEDLKNKVIDLERKDSNENRIELLEEIRELNKKIRELDW